MFMRVRMYCRVLSPWYRTIEPSTTTRISTQLSWDLGGHDGGSGRKCAGLEYW